MIAFDQRARLCLLFQETLSLQEVLTFLARCRVSTWLVHISPSLSEHESMPGKTKALRRLEWQMAKDGFNLEEHVNHAHLIRPLASATELTYPHTTCYAEGPATAP